MSSPMSTHAAADAARQILDALKLDKSTIALVQKKCDAAKAPFSAAWIRKEWRNEVLANRHDRDAVTKACETPAVDFIQFANKVIANPMEPAPRVVRALMERYGLPFVSMMHKTRWPRELIWVDRYRNHPDDIVALLAHAFTQLIQPEQIELPKAERDTSRRGVSHVFSRLVEHAYKTAFSITDIEKDPYCALSEVEIIEAPLPEDWYPLAINFMEASLGGRLRQKNPQALASQAERIREQYRAEKRSEAVEALVERLVAQPLIRKPALLNYALTLGFDATQLQTTYDRFVSDIRSLRLSSDRRTVEGDLMTYMASLRDDPPATPPSPSRAQDLRQELRQIHKGWFNHMDPILREAFDGDRAEVFSKWRNQIESGSRPLSPNLLVDYGLFLIERKQKE